MALHPMGGMCLVVEPSGRVSSVEPSADGATLTSHQLAGQPSEDVAVLGSAADGVDCVVMVRSGRGTESARWYRRSLDAPSVSLAAEQPIEAPKGSTLVAAAVQGGHLALLWSSGLLSAYMLDGARLGRVFDKQLQCLDLGASGAGVTPAGGKRKAAPAAANSPPSASLAGVGGSYVLLTGRASASLGDEICRAGRPFAAVVDLKFGALHAAGGLGDGDGPDISGSRAAAALAGGEVAVQCGSTVLVARLSLPKLTLAAVLASRSATATLSAKVFGGSSAPGAVLVDKPAWRPADQIRVVEEDQAKFLQRVSMPWDLEAMEKAERPVAALLDKLSGAATEAAFTRAAQELLELHARDRRALSSRAVQLVMSECASKRYFRALEGFLRSQAPSSLPWAEGAQQTILEARRYPLLQLLLATSSLVPPSALALLLEHALRAGEDAAPALSELRDSVKRAAVKAVERAEEMPIEEARRQGQLAVAACSAAAVDGFSPREVMLHGLLAQKHDATSIAAAVQPLAVRDVLRLLRYAAKWLHKYNGPLSLYPTLPALPLEVPVPPVQHVLSWVAVVLDVHLPKLAMHAECDKVVSALRSEVGMHKATCRSLAAIKGVAEHIQMRAPLPPPTGTTAADYQIEILDLRVGGEA